MNDRHDRVSSLLKELAAEFIQHEANTDPLITVTNADISPDYKRATIFITTIPDDKEEAALIFLKRYAGEFRQFIKKKISMKTIPHIDFVLDVGERHRQHIDEISRDIKKED
jgi:ribosome-binding factor A